MFYICFYFGEFYLTLIYLIDFISNENLSGFLDIVFKKYYFNLWSYD